MSDRATKVLCCCFLLLRVAHVTNTLDVYVARLPRLSQRQQQRERRKKERKRQIGTTHEVIPSFLPSFLLSFHFPRIHDDDNISFFTLSLATRCLLMRCLCTNGRKEAHLICRLIFQLIPLCAKLHLRSACKREKADDFVPYIPF